MTSNLSDERRCTAKSKRSGDRCKKAALLGAKTCATHGSANAVSRAAAERRLIEAEAGQMVRRLLIDPDAPPVDNPVLELMRIAGRMGHAVDVLGERVNEVDAAGRLDYADANLVRRLHVIVEAWKDLMVEYRRTLTDMTRLRIEERAVLLQEQQGVMLGEVIARSADALLAAVVGAVDEAAAEAVRRAWPGWVQVIVPREIAAVAGGER